MAASAISKSSSAGDEDPLPRVFPPATLPDIGQETQSAVICLKDGTVYQGYSFGAAKSICGECVFQTGNLQMTIFHYDSLIINYLKEWSAIPNH